MQKYIHKFNNFISLYNAMLFNLLETKRKYTISFYYLNNEFNINIVDNISNEIIFKYHFQTTLEEYNSLIFLLGNNFIDLNSLIISYFEPMNIEDSKLYYNSIDKDIPLDYNKAKIHLIRNPYFDFRIYYFQGLNDIAHLMQDKSLLKIYKKN